MLTKNITLDTKELKSEIYKIFNEDTPNLYYFESCESTNLECLKLAEHNSVFVAEQQTDGRGRRGNSWHSPFSDNIYCSIGLNKSIKAESLGLISLQVGVSIAQVLQAQGIDGVSLKWPNDILLRGKKLGGILIETRAKTQNEFYFAIGFGLNVNLTNDDLEQINQPAIGLNQIKKPLLNRQQLLALLISQILQDVMKFDEHLIDQLINSFNQIDEMQGKEVLVKTRNEELTGIHLGIQRTGHIKIRTSAGVQTFSAAEISLREN